MDDAEFKRFEDKQKLSNLMIEKRFITLEAIIDDLKTKVEKDSLNENVPKEINDLKNMINVLKEEKKKELEQLTALVESVDVTDVKKDVSGMSKTLEDITTKVNDFSNKLQAQDKDILRIEEKIVNGSDDEKILSLSMKIKQIESSIESLKIKIASVVDYELTKPIIID